MTASPAIPEPTYLPSTDGVEVAVHDLGGSGPVLILSHATGFCGGVWKPMVETLSEHYHCLALDYRGHGHTRTPAATTMAWSGMAHDLLRVLDACSPDEPAMVAGHSMGGAAIVLAEALRPGRIAKAWGFEPILFDQSTMPAEPSGPDGLAAESSDLAVGAARRRDTFDSRQDAFERYGSKPPLQLLDPRALQAYVDYGFADTEDGSVTLRCTPARESETFSATRLPDEGYPAGAYAAAGTIGFDYRILVSGDGQPPAVMAERASDLPHMTLGRFDHLTHFGPLQSPEEMAADVIDWFSAS